jgi:hypothetical protein
MNLPLATAAVVVLCLAACTASTSTDGPSYDLTGSTQPPTSSVASTPTSAAPLPHSNYADNCVEGNAMWRKKLFAILTSGPATASESQANAIKLRRIIYFLELNGGGMIVEDRKRGGPVLSGDECLSGAAGSLSLMSSFVPHGPLLDQLLKDAASYYRELLRVYPQSRHLDDARKFLATV